MTYRRPDHPDTLEGPALVARTKGDALHLVGLVRDHGPDTLHAVLDYWGPDHARRVVVALACAIDPDAPTRDLWSWLDGKSQRTSRSVDEQTLWTIVPPSTYSKEAS